MNLIPPVGYKGILKTPTLIIWGFSDPTAPYELGVDLTAQVSKVVDRTELHVINRSGHLVFAEHPEKATGLIAVRDLTIRLTGGRASGPKL